MKKLRKLVSVCFVIALASLLLFASALATATSGPCGTENDNALWNYDSSTKTLSITGTGEVLWYSQDWDTYKAEIQSVVIGEGITALGSYDNDSDGLMFSGCAALTSVQLPSTLKEIGQSVFKDCSSLQIITIPKSIEKIGIKAFKGSGLTKINFTGTQTEWENITKGDNAIPSGVAIEYNVGSSGSGSSTDSDILLAASFDKSTYAPGDTAILTVSVVGTASKSVNFSTLQLTLPTVTGLTDPSVTCKLDGALLTYGSSTGVIAMSVVGNDLSITSAVPLFEISYTVSSDITSGSTITWNPSGTKAVLINGYEQTANTPVATATIVSSNIDENVVTLEDNITIVSGADTTTHAFNGTSTIVVQVSGAPEGKIVLGITATQETTSLSVTRNTDGTYQFTASGNVTVNLETISGSVSFVSLKDYENNETSTQQIVKVSWAKLSSGGFTIGGKAMYWSSKYSSYVAFVDKSMTESNARANLLKTTSAAEEITYETGLIRGNSSVSVADVAAINAELHSAAVTYTVTDLMRFMMDVNGDGAINVSNMLWVLQEIAGVSHTANT